MLTGTTRCDAGAEDALDALRDTALGDLPATAWEVVRPQVTGLLEGSGQN